MCANMSNVGKPEEGEEEEENHQERRRSNFAFREWGGAEGGAEAAET